MSSPDVLWLFPDGFHRSFLAPRAILTGPSAAEPARLRQAHVHECLYSSATPTARTLLQRAPLPMPLESKEIRQGAWGLLYLSS